MVGRKCKGSTIQRNAVTAYKCGLVRQAQLKGIYSFIPALGEFDAESLDREWFAPIL